jgi:hypothetical protein
MQFRKTNSTVHCMHSSCIATSTVAISKNGVHQQVALATVDSRDTKSEQGEQQLQAGGGRRPPPACSTGDLLGGPDNNGVIGWLSSSDPTSMSIKSAPLAIPGTSFVPAASKMKAWQASSACGRRWELNHVRWAAVAESERWRAQNLVAGGSSHTTSSTGDLLDGQRRS